MYHVKGPHYEVIPVNSTTQRPPEGDVALSHLVILPWHIQLKSIICWLVSRSYQVLCYKLSLGFLDASLS